MSSWWQLKYFFHFHPKKWGNDPNWLYNIFEMGGWTTTNKRCNFSGSLTQKELPGRLDRCRCLGSEVVQTIPTIGFNVETAPTSFDETYGHDVSVSPMRGRGGFSRMRTFFVVQPRPSLMTSHSVFIFHLLCPPGKKKGKYSPPGMVLKTPSVNHGIFPSPTLSGVCRWKNHQQ